MVLRKDLCKMERVLANLSLLFSAVLPKMCSRKLQNCSVLKNGLLVPRALFAVKSRADISDTRIATIAEVRDPRLGGLD